MKTLVIHPKDATTDFLSVIYKDIADLTVITNTNGINIKNAIKTHDRIIMMGHGDGYGLWDPHTCHYIIDSGLAYLLRDKPESIYIWCNADQFVKRYNLKGFVTGMIISEYEEALMYCIHQFKSDDITESNIQFASTIQKSVNLKPAVMCEEVRKDYYSYDNNIIQFNQQNIYAF